MILAQQTAQRFTWSGDPHHWSQDQKLASLSSPFALQIARLISMLEAEGWQPSIRLAWRDLGVQRELMARGVSDTSFSYHNVVDAQGRPAAVAVDLIDRRYAWGEAGGRDRDRAATFFKRVGESASALRLGWGGDPKRYDVNRPGNVWKKYRIGWDPAHVFEDLSKGEWRSVKVASIEAIERPRAVAAVYGYDEVASTLPRGAIQVDPGAVAVWGGLVTLGAVTLFSPCAC